MSNLSFQEMCVVARVSPVWNRFIENLLTNSLLAECQPGKTLCEYERAIENDSRADQFPPGFQGAKDLKRRYAAVVNFSREFTIFKDFPSVVMIARCSRILPIQGRSWMALYSMHCPVVNKIWDSLAALAKQKKLAFAVEAQIRSENGKPIEGYHVGLEEVRSKILANALVAHKDFSNWLSLKNGTISLSERGLLDCERFLFHDFDLPFVFILENFIADFEKGLSKSTFRELEKFANDHVRKVLLPIKKTQGELTKAQMEEHRVPILMKAQKEVLNLLKSIIIDCSERLIKDKVLDKKIRKQITDFLNLPSGQRREAFYRDVISPKLIVDLRNRMWGSSIQSGIPFIPKDVPHVLAAGAAHIPEMLTFLESTNGKPEKKKNGKK